MQRGANRSQADLGQELPSERQARRRGRGAELHPGRDAAGMAQPPLSAATGKLEVSSDSIRWCSRSTTPAIPSAAQMTPEQQHRARPIRTCVLSGQQSLDFPPPHQHLDRHPTRETTSSTAIVISSPRPARQVISTSTSTPAATSRSRSPPNATRRARSSRRSSAPRACRPRIGRSSRHHLITCLYHPRRAIGSAKVQPLPGYSSPTRPTSA